MGFILYTKNIIYHKFKQADRTHASTFCSSRRPGGDLPADRRTENFLHRLDRQVSGIDLHAPHLHRLPAAGAVCGITARPRLPRSRDPRTRPLPSAPRLESPGCVRGHVRPPGLSQVSTCGCTSSRSARSGLAPLAHIVSPWYWVWHTCARPSPSTRRCHATLSAPIMPTSNCP